MSDDHIRAIVRDVVRRRLAAPAPPPDAPNSGVGPSFESHPSHARFLIVPGGDGPCLIEPIVTCTHCGFCQSHGY